VKTHGGNSHAYAVTSLLASSGGGSWEYVYTKDSNADECMLFGFGTKPITSSSYSDSPNMWLVRAFNGEIYGSGKASRTASKLHEGNRISFTWSSGSGEVKLFVNGAEDGIVFTGVTLAEIFPCVASYGSTGEVALVRIERATSKGA
jgi:hypothetical protein